jgi:hypothetical protein
MKLTDKGLSEYWNSLLDRRMPEGREVERLISVMKGFYFSYCIHNETLNQNHEQGLIEFHSSKRPYGNKDIPASIAFNLGWDYKRQLCYYALPDEIEAIAEDLHKKVLEELKKNTSLYV